MTKEDFNKHAMALYDFCEYPTVRYKILFSFLDTPYEDKALTELRKEFLKSDIVEDDSGEYSYEADRATQHEIFLTREDRLVPMQSELLLKRRDRILPEIEAAMLRHLGGNASVHGHFWDKTPYDLPENFRNDKMRRWFHTFNYINQFRGSKLYLANAVEWLLKQANSDGLWDWGPQIKDPWGYFGYFSCNRHYQHNRVVDCTIEILSFLKKYIENNEE